MKPKAPPSGRLKTWKTLRSTPLLDASPWLRAAPYAGSGDVLMVDWYPVPHLPLETVGRQIRDAVAAARSELRRRHQRRPWPVVLHPKAALARLKEMVPTFQPATAHGS